VRAGRNWAEPRIASLRAFQGPMLHFPRIHPLPFFAAGFQIGFCLVPSLFCTAIYIYREVQKSSLGSEDLKRKGDDSLALDPTLTIEGCQFDGRRQFFGPILTVWPLKTNT